MIEKGLISVAASSRLDLHSSAPSATPTHLEVHSYNPFARNGVKASDVSYSLKLSPEAEAGKQVFNAMGCQACHLPIAGTIAPSLYGLIGREREFVDGSKLIADEAYIRDSIMNSTEKVVKGFAPAMPPYATVIREEQLVQLVAYIQSLSD